MNEAKIKEMSLKINGQRINEISYADDEVVIAETEAPMQKMIDKINRAEIKLEMKINAALPNQSNILNIQTLSIVLRKRIMRCYIWTVERG